MAFTYHNNEEAMTKEEFLKKCESDTVAGIVPIENDCDDGFKVLFSGKSAVYILFRDEYGDAWMEYETEEHFIERWKNRKTLTPAEEEEYSRRTLQSMKDKYSNENFKLFAEILNSTPQ